MLDGHDGRDQVDLLGAFPFARSPNGCPHGVGVGAQGFRPFAIARAHQLRRLVRHPVPQSRGDALEVAVVAAGTHHKPLHRVGGGTLVEDALDECPDAPGVLEKEGAANREPRVALRAPGHVFALRPVPRLRPSPTPIALSRRRMLEHIDAVVGAVGIGAVRERQGETEEVAHQWAYRGVRAGGERHAAAPAADAVVPRVYAVAVVRNGGAPRFRRAAVEGNAEVLARRIAAHAPADGPAEFRQVHRGIHILRFFNCCGQSRSPLKNGDLSSFEEVLNPLIYRTFVKPGVARNSRISPLFLERLWGGGELGVP